MSNFDNKFTDIKECLNILLLSFFQENKLFDPKNEIIYLSPWYVTVLNFVSFMIFIIFYIFFLQFFIAILLNKYIKLTNKYKNSIDACIKLKSKTSNTLKKIIALLTFKYYDKNNQEKSEVKKKDKSNEFKLGNIFLHNIKSFNFFGSTKRLKTKERDIEKLRIIKKQVKKNKESYLNNLIESLEKNKIKRILKLIFYILYFYIFYSFLSNEFHNNVFNNFKSDLNLKKEFRLNEFIEINNLDTLKKFYAVQLKSFSTLLNENQNKKTDLLIYSIHFNFSKILLEEKYVILKNENEKDSYIQIHKIPKFKGFLGFSKLKPIFQIKSYFYPNFNILLENKNSEYTLEIYKKKNNENKKENFKKEEKFLLDENFINKDSQNTQLNVYMINKESNSLIILCYEAILTYNGSILPVVKIEVLEKNLFNNKTDLFIFVILMIFTVFLFYDSKTQFVDFYKKRIKNKYKYEKFKIKKLLDVKYFFKWIIKKIFEIIKIIIKFFYDLIIYEFFLIFQIIFYILFVYSIILIFILYTNPTRDLFDYYKINEIISLLKITDIKYEIQKYIYLYQHIQFIFSSALIFFIIGFLSNYSFSAKLSIVYNLLIIIFKELIAFLLMIILIISGYGVIGYVIYGNYLKEYSFFFSSCLEILFISLGDFDYEKLKKVDQYFTFVFVFSYLFIAYMFFIRFFIIILYTHYVTFVQKTNKLNFSFLTNLIEFLKKVMNFLNSKIEKRIELITRQEKKNFIAKIRLYILKKILKNSEYIMQMCMKLFFFLNGKSFGKRKYRFSFKNKNNINFGKNHFDINFEDTRFSHVRSLEDNLNNFLKKNSQNEKNRIKTNLNNENVWFQKINVFLKRNSEDRLSLQNLKFNKERDYIFSLKEIKHFNKKWLEMKKNIKEKLIDIKLNKFNNNQENSKTYDLKKKNHRKISFSWKNKKYFKINNQEIDSKDYNRYFENLKRDNKIENKQFTNINNTIKEIINYIKFEFFKIIQKEKNIKPNNIKISNYQYSYLLNNNIFFSQYFISIKKYLDNVPLEIKILILTAYDKNLIKKKMKLFIFYIIYNDINNDNISINSFLENLKNNDNNDKSSIFSDSYIGNKNQNSKKEDFIFFDKKSMKLFLKFTKVYFNEKNLKNNDLCKIIKNLKKIKNLENKEYLILWLFLSEKIKLQFIYNLNKRKNFKFFVFLFLNEIFLLDINKQKYFYQNNYLMVESLIYQLIKKVTQ